jgi:hypothetical protein
LDKTAYSSMPFVRKTGNLENPYEMPIGEYEKEDLRWLIS